MPIGIVQFLDTGIQDNLVDKTKELGVQSGRSAMLGVSKLSARI
ncbi:hypothetical protein QA639_33110 [Bradyrhizobium pachyrhizi]|nr:hypothetical protein [Bradyrhizobium pachyrhizi]WFU54442.1 hypothetical protein QA639_33110 [Bradyrhizobium pachyrhizi]